MPQIETDAIEKCIAYYEQFMHVACDAIFPSDWGSPLVGRALYQLHQLTAQAQVNDRHRLLPHPDDVELALRANGTADACHCDPSVGMSPCQYCAIDSVLRRVLRVVKTHPERRRIQTPASTNAEL